MKFKLFIYTFLSLLILTAPSGSRATDWPIYKGNIYFTGNNDEIIVKNNNLKWLFQADERVFNPIVSDSRVYFTDKLASVYCLDEEYGKLIWKINLKQISAQFRAFSPSAGKVKYPLIKNDTLFLSDPVAIYAISKKTGAVLWARTGMREEETRPDLAGRTSLPVVDGIYADPVILDNNIYYGTRNMFISREIRNGHSMWDNRNIKTYSGFPTFYDDKVFTQSMDYGTGRYTVYCLKADSGKEIWSRDIRKPERIFPPVVYKEKIYIPSDKSIHCLNIKNGEDIWLKDYGDYITSNPSFTDRSIIFSIGNSDIAVIDPENGNIIHTVKVSPKSGPNYVTVRDQLYIAYTAYETIKEKETPYGILRAVDFSEDKALWEYKTPFPGAVSQPASSLGIMFLPAGNYLYAIGTEYYAHVIEGGSGHAAVPGEKKTDGSGNLVQPPQPVMTEKEPEEIKTRKMSVSIKNRDNEAIPAAVEVKKREKGKLIYSKIQNVDRQGTIEVPEGDGVELLASAMGHVPKKEIINQADKEKEIILDKISRGRSYDIDNVLFEVNKSYLKKESLDILDRLISIMKENPDLKIEIRGHTDSTGEEKYNQKLSERRADAVAEYMIKNNISPERLNSVGFGETKPVASNDSEEGRSKNRRTEIYFKK